MLCIDNFVMLEDPSCTGARLTLAALTCMSATVCLSLLQKSTGTERHLLYFCLAGQGVAAVAAATKNDKAVEMAHNAYMWAIPAAIFAFKQKAGLVLILAMLAARTVAALLFKRCVFYFQHPNRGNRPKHHLTTIIAAGYILYRIMSE